MKILLTILQLLTSSGTQGDKETVESRHSSETKSNCGERELSLDSKKKVNDFFNLNKQF